VYEWVQSPADALPTDLDEYWQATIVGGVIVAMRYYGFNHTTADGLSSFESTKLDVLSVMGLPVKETHNDFLSDGSEILEYHGVRFFLSPEVPPYADAKAVPTVDSIEVFQEPR